jgi:hypothetical protein
LATKWSDGDPCDPFCVGFVAGIDDRGRYAVVDGDGKSLSRTAFRKAKVITKEEGEKPIALPQVSDVSGGRSVWWRLKNIRSDLQARRDDR